MQTALKYDIDVTQTGRLSIISFKPYSQCRMYKQKTCPEINLKALDLGCRN